MLGLQFPGFDATEQSPSSRHLVRFIDKQLENKKTSRVLEAAFGEEWGQTYMREVGGAFLGLAKLPSDPREKEGR